MICYILRVNMCFMWEPELYIAQFVYLSNKIDLVLQSGPLGTIEYFFWVYW
jgi:hypothetical protein